MVSFILYCGPVRFNWKIAGLLSALSLFVAGCGGLSASHSVSPASFFLPGLLQADPPAQHPDQPNPVEEPDTKVAQL